MMLRPISPLLIAIFACLALSSVLAGCRSAVVRRSVERRVERKLAGILGPAERYQVCIRGTQDAELVRGRAKRVEIEGRKILARGQLEVESLQLTLDDLRYEGGEPQLVSVKRSDLQLTFTQESINRYLRTYQARYDPEIALEAGRVHVKMVYPFLGVPTTIRAVGHFVIEDGRKLLFDADQADVSFISMPGFGEKFVEDRINPLLDMARIDFPARLESVELLAGRLKAHGSATLPREHDD